MSSYESPRYEPCPKCGSNFHLPQEYDTGSKKHPAVRNCSCAPDASSVLVCVDNPGLQTIVDQLTRRLDEQAKFVKVLLAMMPKSTGSMPDSYSPPWNSAIDVSLIGPSMLPEDFVRRAVASADSLNVSRPADQGAEYDLCLICGQSHEIGRTDTPESAIKQLSICYSCGIIQKNHPDVFAWMWRIIRWHYHVWATKIPTTMKEPLGRNIITE